VDHVRGRVPCLYVRMVVSETARSAVRVAAVQGAAKTRVPRVDASMVAVMVAVVAAVVVVVVVAVAVVVAVVVVVAMVVAVAVRAVNVREE